MGDQGRRGDPPGNASRAGEPPGDADGSDETQAIRLDAVLKLAGIVGTGGQAKQLIQSGRVKVNGAVETRRKHLLRAGDEVAVGEEVFVVELAEGGGAEDDEGRDA